MTLAWRRAPGAAHPLELPLLEDAKQLALQLGREVADLVEEDGPVVGHLELAGLARGGAGERAALVPEQLGLEQGLDDGRAVDAHERPRVVERGSCWMTRATSSLPVPTRR